MSQALNSFPPIRSPKAQSSWRERNIQEVERLLAADRETVFKNPESFSARLSLQSTENRLLELRNSPQIYLCADCGREITGAINDLGFGLCDRCEQKQTGRLTPWAGSAVGDNKKPCHRAVGPGEEKTFSVTRLSLHQAKGDNSF